MSESVERQKFFTIEKSTALLSQLVEVDTCQPVGNEAKLVSLIEDRYDGYPVTMTRLDHGSGRASLVVELPGEQRNGALAFVGHLDTVPVGDPTKWSSPPLAPSIKAGKLVARGAADMKGGLAAMLLALDYLLVSKKALKKSLYFCFTADEENTGAGALAIRQSGLIADAVQMIICEPSGGSIGICEKGAFWIRVSAEGSSCHASRPELGQNAIDALIVFMDHAHRVFDYTQTHPLLGRNSLSLTQFEGGVSTNIVPARADLTLDIRTLPGVSHMDIYERFNEICQAVQQEMSPLSMKVEIINNRPPLETPKTEDLVVYLQACAKKLGMSLPSKGLYFYTDASQLIPLGDMPFVILGPGDDRQAHSVNEHIELGCIGRFAELYATYAADHFT